MDLTSSDYKKIIKYYNIEKNNKSDKDIAENILANKLCRCIKKVRNGNIDEKAAISICRKRIFRNRNIDFYNFKCKKSRKLVPKKRTSKKLRKFSRKIKFSKTKKL